MQVDKPHKWEDYLRSRRIGDAACNLIRDKRNYPPPNEIYLAYDASNAIEDALEQEPIRLARMRPLVREILYGLGWGATHRGLGRW